jgi:hypothetical protein
MMIFADLIGKGVPPRLQERMNSPLELREVRLRGLHGRPCPGGAESRRSRGFTREVRSGAPATRAARAVGAGLAQADIAVS